MTNRITTKKYKVLDIHLNVAEIGTGKPLILIHGWSNNWIGWTLLAQELAPNYHLYMIDLPGFGDSDRLEKYSLKIVAKYVGEFLKRYVPKPKALIGSSGGTFVIAQILTTQQFLTKIILIGPVFGQKRTQLGTALYKKILTLSQNNVPMQKLFAAIIKSRYSAYFIEKYVNAYRFDKKLVDTYQVPGRKKITGKSYVQLGLSFLNFDMKIFLGLIQNSTLLIFGVADKYVNPTEATSLASTLGKKNITLEFIEKAGHSPSYEQPEKTARVIRNFLKKVA